MQPKSQFQERIKLLMGEEAEQYFEYFRKPLQNFIRCNTLKISPEELKKKLEKKWQIIQPYHEYPEIILVKSGLMPGELGKAVEHLMGYYYIQDVSSMMPPIALDPTETDFVLDITAAPGSKTTQIAARMKNSGLLIANDIRIDRINILASNMERCGVTNTVITREDAVNLCRKLEKRMKFDKILLDTSCSGEGIRDLKTFEIWNPNMIEKFSRQQKRLLAVVLSILKDGGELVYSTCTLTPEENESVIQFALDNFNVKVEEIELPLKSREGINEWRGEKFSSEMKEVHRIYPQDNNSEGFFVAKLRKIGGNR
ncbi:RsmB/NOP family class I SAM-dependent RNA methyltransferase [Candidatus Pacearchaeota archaeon]|nr:RsmB/NOP family class I SAM-dependent RNA methyltransferase [Candidatus Pacearchaeota archaeon]